MTNSATARPPLPVTIWGVTAVIPVLVELTEIGSPLAIYTPAPGNMAAIAGISYGELNPHRLTFGSGDTPEVDFSLGGSSGICQGITKELLYTAQPGESLTIETSVAISSRMVFYIVEAERFFVSR